MNILSPIIIPQPIPFPIQENNVSLTQSENIICMILFIILCAMTLFMLIILAKEIYEYFKM